MSIRRKNKYGNDLESVTGYYVWHYFNIVIAVAIR